MESGLLEQNFPRIVIAEVLKRASISAARIDLLHNNLYKCNMHGRNVIAAFVGEMGTSSLMPMVALYFPGGRSKPYRAFAVSISQTLDQKAKGVEQVIELVEPKTIDMVKSLFPPDQVA